MNTPTSARAAAPGCPLYGLTIFLGESSFANLGVSLKQAAVLERCGQFTHVFYINVAFDNRRFYATQRRAIGTEKANFSSYHVCTGNLARTLQRIQYTLPEGARPAFVINSWEMSSSCYRFREELIFMIQRLIMTLDAGVYVYSQANPEKVKAGYINRTGLGKLPAITDSIIDLTANYNAAKAKAAEGVPASEAATTEAPAEVKEEVKVAEEVAEHSEIEVTADGVFANLPAQEINNLAPAHGHLSKVALDDVIEEEVDEEEEEEAYHEELVEEGELEYA